MRASGVAATVSIMWLCLALTGTWEAGSMVAEATTPSECKSQRDRIEAACRTALLSRTNPSPTCCQRLRETNFVDCVCPISPKLGALLSAYGIQRLVDRVRDCGVSVPRNFKCGSITTPP